MATVPYTFAGDTGNIPLVQLDVNFANVKAFANTAGTVTINAQPNVTSLGTLTTLSVSGNATANYFIGDGSALTNLTIAAGTQIINGNSSVTVAGNSNVSVVVSNVSMATLANTGVYVTGLVSTTGNISATGNLVATANVRGANLFTVGQVSATGNVTGGNILFGSGNVSGTGNITGANVNTTIVSASGNIVGANISIAGNVIGGNIRTSGVVTATGNVIGGNLNAAGLSLSSNVVSNLNVTANISGGNVLFGVGIVSGTGNITGGNIITPGILSVAGNISGGNLSVSGNVYGSVNGYSIGYLNLPQVSASNTVIALSDSGKHYYSTSSSNVTLTIPSDANVPFATGTAIALVNFGSANLNIVTQAAVSLYLGGNSTAGNRVVGSYGMGSIIKVGTNTWGISGTNVS
jgi:hypothetical protein